MGERIQGIFTPNIVPLQANGEIHETELRRYVDWLIQKGVHGLYPNGSTGEFTRFTAEERKRIVKIVCESWPPATLFAGAAEAKCARNTLACETYAGYDAGRWRLFRRLLQAVCGVGLRVFSRDRPEQPDRRDAVQHSHVRQPDRRADDPPFGRVRADRGRSRIRRATWRL